MSKGPKPVSPGIAWSPTGNFEMQDSHTFFYDRNSDMESDSIARDAMKVVKAQGKNLTSF